MTCRKPTSMRSRVTGKCAGLFRPPHRLCRLTRPSKVLSAKLAQLSSGNSTVQQHIEDLEDYYERALQLRMMATATAIEEKKEVQAALAAATAREVRAVAVSAILFLLLLSRFFPAPMLAFVAATWKYLAVAVAVLVANAAIGGGSTKKKKK